MNDYLKKIDKEITKDIYTKHINEAFDFNKIILTKLKEAKNKVTELDYQLKNLPEDKDPLTYTIAYYENIFNIIKLLGESILGQQYKYEANSVYMDKLKELVSIKRLTEKLLAHGSVTPSGEIVEHEKPRKKKKKKFEKTITRKKQPQTEKPEKKGTPVKKQEKQEIIANLPFPDLGKSVKPMPGLLKEKPVKPIPGLLKEKPVETTPVTEFQVPPLPDDYFDE